MGFPLAMFPVLFAVGRTAGWLAQWAENVLDEEQQVLRCRVSVGMSREEMDGLVIPLGEGIAGRVAVSRMPLAIADIREHPHLWRADLAAKHRHVAYLGLPVMRGDQLLGVLAFSHAVPRHFTDAEVESLTGFARQAAIAVGNARLYDAAQRELAERRRAEEALADPIVLRYANVYGPRQEPKGEAGIVAILAEKLLTGQTPRIFDDGEQTRDYVHVSDVVAVHRAALERCTPGAYNVGTGVETSVNSLFEMVTAALGVRVEPVHTPALLAELRRNSLDAALAGRALGVRPRTTLAEGLARTLPWYRERYGR